MNRVLFCAVAGFALGEVYYYGSAGYLETGIAVAVPVFCAYFCLILKLMFDSCSSYTNKRISGIGLLKKIILPASLVITFLCGALYSEKNNITYSIDRCITDNSIAEYERKEYYTIESNGGNAFDCTEVEIEGVITDYNQTASGYAVVISVNCTECIDHKHTDRYKVMAYLKKLDNGQRIIGTYVVVHGQLSYASAATNNGGFDQRDYLRARGISYILLDGNVIDKRNLSSKTIYDFSLFIKDKLYTIRGKLRKIICEITEGASQQIYISLLTGDKSNITEQLKDLFQVGGISHILAISSMHITLICGIAVFTLKKIGMHIYLAQAMGLVIAVIYGGMTGFGNSTVRALIMLSILWLARIMGRNYDVITSGAAALLIMLIIQPYRIADGGMQLSFMAIVAISVGKMFIRRLSHSGIGKRLKRNKSILYKLINMLIMQSCLQLIMLPLVVCSYYEVYPYSFVLNLLVVPLMPIILGVGIMALAASLFSGNIAAIIIQPGCTLIDSIISICRLIDKLNFSRIIVGHPGAMEIICYYTMLLGIIILFEPEIQKIIRLIVKRFFHAWFTVAGFRKVIALLQSLWLIIMMLVIGTIHMINTTEIIAFIDVGQGDCILIRSKNGTTMIIDGGSSSVDEVWDYNIMPTIKYYGIDHIDYWFLSHEDKDHTSGLIQNVMNNDIEINNICVSERFPISSELIIIAVEKEIDIAYIGMESVVTDGSFCMTCLHPDREFESEDSNALSMCLEYESDMVRALFTGDVDKTALEYCKHINGKYDIIKLPHHGSRDALFERLYYMTDNVIISCGYNNRYGHPHYEIIEKVQKAGAKIWRTDVMGAIIIRK